MSQKSNFIVRGGADFSGIKKEMTVLQGQFKGFQAIISGGLQLAGISLGIGALVSFGRKAIEVASDLEEVQNVVDVTFGSMAKDVNDFADTALKQFGLSQLSAKKYTSTMGAMLKSSGLTGEAMKSMAIDLTELSADMASFYNLQNDAAFEKIQAGIAGETKPLRELGINMTVANLEAYALSQGIRESWLEMTQAEQTLLRYNYLLSVTGDAQGDFARTSGSWANQVKLLKEQWQEFMGLMGKALVEILLPVVRFLNEALEALIAVTKEIGKIYVMITGKQIEISDTAGDAADSEIDLSDGVDKAGKAAKKALAPFDELNLLQSSLASGSGGASGLDNIKTNIDTKQITDGLTSGFKDAEDESDKFYLWFTDRWNKLKQMLAVPLFVPAPIFAAIPNPVYDPNWGLEPPPKVEKPVFQPIPSPIYNPNWNLTVPAVSAPVFQPIPNPVYSPNWGLEPPPVPVIEIPTIDYVAYGLSLAALAVKTAESFEGVKTHIYGSMESARAAVNTGLETIRSNFETHKENVGLIAAAASAVLVANIKQGLSTTGTNVNNAISTIQNNLQMFGRNTGNIAAETAKAWANNLSEGYKAASQNFSTFANTTGQNLKAFGSGFLQAAAETARGFVSNMVSGFSSVWNNFKNLMSSIGEEVSGWFRENKSLVLKTTIAAGVIVGAGALALAAPAIIPYAGAALGGLASIPALADGGITNGPMLAMVGDNPGGREVISPLDDLKEMIVSAVTSAMQQSGNSGGSGSGSGDLILKIGETEFARISISAINAEQRRAGRTLLIV